MATGTITLNGINDAALIKILEIKTKYAGEMSFQPNVLQTAMHLNQARQQVPMVPQEYNNAILSWGGPSGLAAVIEILKHIHEHKPG